MGNEKEGTKEYSFAVDEQAKKIRSSTLVEQRESIKKTLLDKKASMQDLIVNGGFLSTVRIAFKRWSLKRFQKKAVSQLGQIEADLKVALEIEKKQQERDKNLEEFNQELQNKENKEPEVKGNDEDLDYHNYTGKGLKAKDNSEIMAQLNDEKELKGFKLETYEKIKGELEKDEAVLNSKIDENEKLISDIIERNKPRGLTYSKELLSEILQKKDAREALKAQLESLKEDERIDAERLQGIPKERQDAQKKLDALVSGYDPAEDLAAIAQGEEYYKQYTPDFKKLETEYLALKVRSDRHDIMRGEELSKMAELEAKYKPQKEIYDKLVNAIASQKQRVENFNIDKAELEHQLESLDQEEKDLNKAKEERAVLIDDGEKKLSELGEFVYRHQSRMYGFDDLLRYDKNSKTYNTQLAQLKSSQANLKRDILNTDVSSVMLDNFTADKVEGIAYGDKLYLNEKQIEGLDLNGPAKISDEEKRRVIETQKIVRALKSRSIFKIMNSNTISEYMTYDESKGDFELHENNEQETKEAYQARIRQKYFKDDNIFHQHKIDSDPKQYRRDLSKQLGKEAFAFAWQKGLAFLASSGMETGAALIGDESLKRVAKVRQNIYTAVTEGKENERAAEGLSEKEQQYADINLIQTSISSCLGIMEAVIYPNNMENPLASTMADLSMVKGLQDMGMLNNKGFFLNGFNIASHVVEMSKAVATIAKSTSDAKDQKKLAEETLKRGHQRFSRFLKEAAAKSEFNRTEAIIELTNTLARDGFMAATGLGGTVVSVGSAIIKATASGIHSYVAGKQNDKELLNSPEILGGINYDKNVIGDDDFNQILQSVTGIKDKGSLAESLRVVDAIDMHRSVKNMKNQPNAEVTRVMKAIGFEKAHTFNKVKVNDILEKTSIKSGNFFTRLRDSIEQKGLHYRGSFSRWIRSIFRMNKLKGDVAAKREDIAHQKQKEIQQSKHTDKELQKLEGAKILYDSYVKRVAQQAKTMNIKDVKTVHAPDPRYNSQLNRELIVKVFAHLPEAAKAFDCKNNPLSKTKVEDLLDKTIDGANEVIANSIKMSNANKSKQTEQKNLQNKDIAQAVL